MERVFMYSAALKLFQNFLSFDVRGVNRHCLRFVQTFRSPILVFDLYEACATPNIHIADVMLVTRRIPVLAANDCLPPGTRVSTRNRGLLVTPRRRVGADRKLR